MSDRIVIADIHAAGNCIKGMRRHAEAAGIDWFKFRREGISIEEARKIPGVQPLIDDVLRAREARRGK